MTITSFYSYYYKFLYSFSSQSFNYTFSLPFLFHIFTFIFFIFSRIISLHIFSKNLLISYKFHKSILKFSLYSYKSLLSSFWIISIYYNLLYISIFLFLFTFFLYHKSSFSLITFHKLYYNSI